ncbi:MAG: hypothetical protein Q8L41_15170 [Anaerolineales bacterium]|nr:hypothetical protein [Anaerolineales bacterium]
MNIQKPVSSLLVLLITACTASASPAPALTLQNTTLALIKKETLLCVS